MIVSRLVRPGADDAADIEHILPHPAQHAQILFVERAAGRGVAFGAVAFRGVAAAVPVDDLQMLFLGDPRRVDLQRHGHGKALAAQRDLINALVDARLGAVVDPKGRGARGDPLVAALLVQLGEISLDIDGNQLVPFGLKGGDSARSAHGDGRALRHAREDQLRLGKASPRAVKIGAGRRRAVLQAVRIRPFSRFYHGKVHKKTPFILSRPIRYRTRHPCFIAEARRCLSLRFSQRLPRLRYDRVANYDFNPRVPCGMRRRSR